LTIENRIIGSGLASLLYIGDRTMPRADAKLAPLLAQALARLREAHAHGQTAQIEKFAQDARILIADAMNARDGARSVPQDVAQRMSAVRAAEPAVLPPDPVDCSVFAPVSVRGGERFILHVYLHPTEQKAAMAAFALASQVEPTLAADIEKGEARQITRSLDAPVRRDAKVDVFIATDGLAIDGTSDSRLAITWTGKAVGDQFVLKVSRWSFRRAFFPVVRFFVDGEPIGHVRLKISRSRFGAADARPVIGRLHRYKKAFLSYSSADRTEVLKRAQGLRAVQIEVFQDVLSLDPGERWSEQILKRIDESDIFLLFWSQAARDSKWVLKEARYALQRKKKSASGAPEIVPVILEGPPPVPPPAWLSHIHFNDPVCYFLAAAPREEA
jgi:hypothetical protein